MNMVHKKIIKHISVYVCTAVLMLLISLPSVTLALSVSTGVISPNRRVPAGTPISFTFTTDTSNVTYTVADSLPQSTLSNSQKISPTLVYRVAKR